LQNIKEILFIADEIVNWTLLAGFSYLLSVSGPDWVKELFQLLPSRKARVGAI